MRLIVLTHTEYRRLRTLLGGGGSALIVPQSFVNRMRKAAREQFAATVEETIDDDPYVTLSFCASNADWPICKWTEENEGS